MKVLLIFGGKGSEHDISIMSARNVVASLEESGHDLNLAYISKDGRWFSVDAIDQDLESDNIFSFDNIDVEVIFPMVHGIGGEDGSIAALGDLLQIPVVGCDAKSSMVAWDKDLCKLVLKANNIPSVSYIVAHNNQAPDYFEATQTLKSETLFIKPASEGSSMGVSKAHSEAEFMEACKLAFEYDNKILIERAIVGRELECAVIGAGSSLRASDVGEIRASDGFYDYESKYNDNVITLIDIPASNLAEEKREAIRDLALKAFRSIGGSGFARVDFFIDNDSEIYVNEINTIPGFTNKSVYPKLCEHAGLSYSEVLNELLDIAVSRKTE